MAIKKASARKKKRRKSPRLLIDIVTIFPSFFESPLNQSILKRAQEDDLIKVRIHDLRQFTHDKHRSVDDKPFGGGPGMVMKPEPIFECVEAIPEFGTKPQKGRTKKSFAARPWVVLLDPHGESLNQKRAAVLSKKQHLILILGHYEGIDHRVRERLVDQEISIGDFITMGGGAPAVCLLEAVARLVPGVLGNKDSIKHESFETGELEYPQYTRPRDYRGMKVPAVLLSGHHDEVKKWRSEIARRLTQKKRPDLIKE